jgi:hypothetical protein
MKNLKLYLVTIFLLPISSFALTPWGVPTYVDIAAYAVNDYSQYRINNNTTLGSLSRYINKKNAFINHLQGELKTKYPSISSMVRYNRENSAATIANFINDNTDLSEFVFFSGHGGYNSLLFYDWKLQATIQLISFENPSLSGGKSFSEMKGIISESLGKNFKSISYYDNFVYLDSCKSDFRMDISNLKKNQNQA